MQQFKKLILVVSTLFFCFGTSLRAQSNRIDSLRRVLQQQSLDTARVSTLVELGRAYLKLRQFDSVVATANAVIGLSQKFDIRKQLIKAYDMLGEVHYYKHENRESQKYFFTSLDIATEIHDQSAIAYACRQIGWAYQEMQMSEKALEYWNRSYQYYATAKDTGFTILALSHTGNIYAFENNFDNADSCYREIMRLVNAKRNKKESAYWTSVLASYYQQEERLLMALSAQREALEMYTEIGDKEGIGDCKRNIADLLRITGDIEGALRESYETLAIRQELNDSFGYAQLTVNIGHLLLGQGKTEEALARFFSALDIFKRASSPEWGPAYCYTAIGSANKRVGDMKMDSNDSAGADPYYKESIRYYSLALEEWHKTQEYNVNGAASVNCNIGDIYLRMNNAAEARKYLELSFKQAESIKDLSVISASARSLYIIYNKAGNADKALHYLEKYNEAKESLEAKQNKIAMVRMTMNYDFDRKAAQQKAEQEKKESIDRKEIEKQKLIRNGTIGGMTLALLFSGLLFNRYRITRRQKSIIEKEKQRSEDLLLNILPYETAQELKEKGSAEAKQFDEVTVMFTDFKGFTLISEKLTPTELINEIDTCFKAFDHIIEKYKIEKIKTMGDSYMCAGGLPVANTTHALDVVKAGLEIQNYMQEHFRQRKSENKEAFEIRIGIHTGPVVAGIVGIKKFAYDIWGDTVNIASRMESSGETGKVNISGSTYELVKSEFQCEYRGKIQAKNKGEIDMYFVN